MRHYLEKPITIKKKKKKVGGVAKGVGPEFKPQYCKKKKKYNLKRNYSTLICWNIYNNLK
jgi:hypothetical protein